MTVHVPDTTTEGTCTCGDPKPHIIARRSTADGKHICLWDDGSLTWALGFSIRGSMHPKTEVQRVEARKVGWLVLGEVCLFSAAEVHEVISAARWAVKRDGLAGTLHKRIRTQREAAGRPTWLKPDWRTYQADRGGRPVVRVWRLHRLSPWVGHVVWCERGRYELLRRIAPTHNHRDESVVATGIEFATLGEMTRWLAANIPTTKIVPT